MIRSCKNITFYVFLQDSYKIVHILQEKINFSARVANIYVRSNAKSCKSCKKILGKLEFIVKGSASDVTTHAE